MRHVQLPTFTNRKVMLHDLATVVDQALLVLSVLLLCLMAWDFFVTSTFVYFTEVLYFILWMAFIIEFIAKLVIARNRFAYLRKEFLVIFIIIFPFLRPLRLFPASRWAMVMIAEQLNDRFPIFRKLRLLEILLISTVLVVLSADLFMLFETGPNTKFVHFADAIWFSVVTVATVGYGDIYPQTTPGRVLATFLIIFGFSIFGLLTATISSYFVERNIKSGRRSEQQEHQGLAIEESVVAASLERLYSKIETLEKKIDSLERHR